MAALGLALEADVVKIKVPLGLPDPTPHIPVSNPPTLAKWRLGKKLFFDDQLLPKTTTRSESCASCHDPKQGFTVWNLPPVNVRYNTLSLINVVYNKQQFWDGRVDALEQVVQRQLLDEDAPVEPFYEQTQSPEYRHSWGGVIRRLGGRKEYLKEFKEVFGTDPTIDNVGKALATYMRTLPVRRFPLRSGRETRQEDKARPPELLAKHFLPHLHAGELKKLGRAMRRSRRWRRILEQGRRLFLKSGCQQCHSGPLFTDQGYHNIGVGDSYWEFKLSGTVGTGRFNALPLGLKDRRFIGACTAPRRYAICREPSRTCTTVPRNLWMRFFSITIRA